jgi:hypothetical protein
MLPHHEEEVEELDVAEEAEDGDFDDASLAVAANEEELDEYDEDAEDLAGKGKKYYYKTMMKRTTKSLILTVVLSVFPSPSKS